MKWSLAQALTVALALPLGVGVAGVPPASAQMPSQCNDFVKLREDAQKKAFAIGDAQKRGADRKDVCTLVQRFAAAEGVVVKFLEDNKTWCGIPDQAVSAAKANHEKTLKFRTAACTEAPQPRKVPTLSDSIGTPTVDTGKNTKTGHGTFDTLTGNPLAR